MNDSERRDDPVRGEMDPAGDGIEALLRTTGSRPAVPTDRARRVEATVRAHWQTERRARTRRRWTWAALATAATLIVGLGLVIRWPRVAPQAEARPGARVEMVSETAWGRSSRHDAPFSLRLGDEVREGDEVATEDGGRVALRMAKGHSVRLDAGTRVRVLSDSAVALDRGAVYVDSRGPAGAASGAVDIRTPLGTIRDQGTQFEVRWLATSVRVRVREGRVSVSGEGAAAEVTAGRELELGQDGRVARRDVASFGTDLDWIGGITPMLDIDGRTLQSFLDWIARERGVRLQFATPDVAASAPTIVLNGSIRGMTLDQAIEAVLSTCQMSHRLEGETLVIQSAKQPGGRS